jgi:hypothetical protein
MEYPEGSTSCPPVVRSVLVTALTLDIGRNMGWPSRLAARRDDDIAAAPPGELTRAR